MNKMIWNPKCFLLCAVLLWALHSPVLGAGPNEVITESPGKPDTSIQELHLPSAETTAQTTRETNFLRDLDTELEASTTSAPPPPTTVWPRTFKTSELATSAPLVTQTPSAVEKFPEDLFSLEERRRGWVALHITGIIYMFASLVIVSEEFFVPALRVITDIFDLSSSVAGATIMAAACSVPRLLAFSLGLFLLHGQARIDTIMESAVFNILFVIGMCALFSREVLHLTWWPLFRDVSFYIIDLVLLIIFFLDNVIVWWESMILMLGYALYVLFMKFNVKLERSFKGLLHKHKGTVIAMDDHGKSHSVVVSFFCNHSCPVPRAPPDHHYAHSHTNTSIEYNVSCLRTQKQQDAPREDRSEDASRNQDGSHNYVSEPSPRREGLGESRVHVEEEQWPLSLKWPGTWCERVKYLLRLPVVVPLWITLPDVRKQKSRNFFVITLLGSLLWMTVFLYLTVWWAYQVAETVFISEHIMDTLSVELALPVLITAVITARQGFGDMATAIAFSSNIFDITLGLPVPWLVYSVVHDLAPVAVSSAGLSCFITIFFFGLLLVIIFFASCKLKMNKVLGFTLVLLYILLFLMGVMLKDRGLISMYCRGQSA